MSESQGEGAPTDRPASQGWALPDGDGGQPPAAVPAPGYPSQDQPAPGYPPQGQLPPTYPAQPSAPQPYGAQPGQPYAPQPYPAQPYAAQPYPAQPYAPQPPAYGPQPYGRPAYPPPAYPAGAYGYPPAGYPPAGYPAAGYPPSDPPTAKPAWDWCSVAGFVVSFLAAGLGVGFALAIAGIVRTQRGVRRGRGLAIAGLVVCLVWLVAWAAWPQDEEDSPGGGVDAGRATAAAPVTPSAGGSPSATPTTPKAKPSPPSAKPSPVKPSPTKPRRDHRVGINDLKPGECVDVDDDEDETAALPVVSCAGDHTAEVISQVDLPKTAYPGQKSLDARAWVVCQAHFDKALEVSRLDSFDYDLFTYYPDQDAWRHGDRRITCLLVDYDGDDLHGQQLHLDGRAI